VGGSSLGGRVLEELAAFHDRPGAVDILVDQHMTVAGVVADGGGWAAVRFLHAADERAQLADMLAAGDYDHVLVLGYRDGLSAAEADAHTLLTLATIRQVLAGHGRPPRIVAEVVDGRNVEIAEAVGADDLVVSDRLSSLLIAQLAEAPLMRGIFAELFHPAGSSIELRPAGRYAAGDGTFAAVVAAARARGEVAIGYRVADGGTVTINPPKSAAAPLSAADQVIVLARAATRRPRTAGTGAT